MNSRNTFGEDQHSTSDLGGVSSSGKPQEESRLRTDKLASMVDNIPALVAYIDSSEIYRFVNTVFKSWFGLEKEEVIGRTMEQLLGPLAYHQIKPRIERVLAGEAVTFEEPIVYKNGVQKFVNVSYAPDIDSDNKVLGFFALVIDISSFKVTEELNSVRDRERAITESFTDHAILSTDIDGLIRTWNSGAQNIFGYTDEEIIGRSADIIFTPEDIEKGIPQKEMQDAQTKGRALAERWHIRKDGSRFFASGVLRPLFVGEKLAGYAQIATDLTEKKKIAESLQSAHDEMELRVAERTRSLADANVKLKTEYEERAEWESRRIELLQKLLTIQEDERRRIARDIHDQFGQLMTGLRLKIASLDDLATSNKELKARIAQIQKVAEALDSEVSILAWELRPLVLDEYGLVEAMRTFVNSWSKHYEIGVDFYASGFKDLALADEVESHLYRIAQEALNNIAKHAHASHVSVILERSAERPDNSVVMIIEDNGVGFIPEEVSEIHSSGGGLGLIGMRERAAMIGGEIELESAHGDGATIYVRIPVKE